MPQRVDAWLRHQQHRWIRPDAARYLRPDAARFLKPKSDTARVYPALERKFPGQNRLPDGDGGGQYTFGRMNGVADDADRPRVIITKPDEPRETEGDGGDGDGVGAGDFLGIGNFLQSIFAAASNLPGIGHNRGPKLEDPPKLPQTRPRRLSPDLRKAANWLLRARSPQQFAATVAFLGVLWGITWVREKFDEIITDLDPPKTLEELSAAVHRRRAGTELHHFKMERHVAMDRGMSPSEVDAPHNLIRIPVLKHRQISDWYRQPNDDHGGLTPRQFLADKPAADHERVGIEALIQFGVLKP